MCKSVKCYVWLNSVWVTFFAVNFSFYSGEREAGIYDLMNRDLIRIWPAVYRAGACVPIRLIDRCKSRAQFFIIQHQRKRVFGFSVNFWGWNYARSLAPQ